MSSTDGLLAGMELIAVFGFASTPLFFSSFLLLRRDRRD